MRAVRASIALSLPRFFGNSPEFWLNAQRELDLWEAERLPKAALNQVKPLPAAQLKKANNFPRHRPMTGCEH